MDLTSLLVDPRAHSRVPYESGTFAILGQKVRVAVWESERKSINSEHLGRDGRHEGFGV
jgi:hypothetical protein